MHSICITREVEQEKLIVTEINKILEDKTQDFQFQIHALKNQIKENRFDLNEIKQQNNLLHAVIKEKLTHKDKGTIVIASLMAVVVIAVFVFVSTTEKQEHMKTGYFTYNLKGDQIYTSHKWNSQLRVHIQNLASVSDSKLQVVRNSILSNESMLVDDTMTHKAPSGEKSIFYVGWIGAIGNDLPLTVNFVDSAKNANVIISLVKTKNMDGYLGWTESRINDHHIIQSHVTIFTSDQISEDELGTIVRHEFGHVLGLEHSTDPDDLMSPTITTTIPYISECDQNALSSLYKYDTVVHTCEK